MGNKCCSREPDSSDFRGTRPGANPLKKKSSRNKKRDLENKTNNEDHKIGYLNEYGDLTIERRNSVTSKYGAKTLSTNTHFMSDQSETRTLSNSSKTM